MDQFERLRYQSPERRKQLLDEIIKAELLAEEARRRGLDKQPETKNRIRQILREDLLRKVRGAVPPPSKITEREAREFYDKHREDFRDPERRRVAHIVLDDRAKAAAVLAEAKRASPQDWGRLVAKHSLDKPPQQSKSTPLELAGDLGIVGPPGVAKGDNPRVPEPLRKAVFEIDKVGGVHAQLVEADGKIHIVRMTGKTDARDRTFKEAERTIRVQILQDRLKQAEKKLETELRGRFPVKIDEKALDKVELPALEKQGGAPKQPAP
jgi:parvulin-like peptidyl-prolyl isomerase